LIHIISTDALWLERVNRLSSQFIRQVLQIPNLKHQTKQRQAIFASFLKPYKNRKAV